MFIADSVEAFQHRFTHSLRGMLSPDQAGAFILVLANSLQDELSRAALRYEIESMYRAIQSSVRDNRIRITDDDQTVIEALELSGIESLTAWQTVRKGAWEVLFNPIRALRPARASNAAFEAIMQPFEPDKFNFNKPFLRPEILWEGRWQKTQLRVLYNKFPFVPYHLIIVPNAEEQLPQYLTLNYHSMIWQLLEQQHTVLTGFGVGYNSLGACASVNQLHFQSFMREAPLPVERPHWQHNGGDEPYPVNCFTFDSKQACWQLIDRYHTNNQPYNLLYRPGRCYVLPRIAQGDEHVLPRVRGAGWIEQCGVFNVTDRTDFESVSAIELEDCLRSLSVSS